MAFQKVDFNKEFFNEFSQDPKSTFKNYGIEFKPTDAEFFNQDFKHMSFDDFKARIENSRFFSFFDFSA